MAFGISLVVVGEESTTHEVHEILHVAGSGAVFAVLVVIAVLVSPLPRSARHADARDGRPGPRDSRLPPKIWYRRAPRVCRRGTRSVRGAQ